MRTFALSRRSLLAAGGGLAMASAFRARAWADDVVTSVVETRAGPITGRIVGDVQVFKGVPFAAPPIGPLRFRPPQPHAPWTRPLDAAAYGFSPMQAAPAQAAANYSEDCLTLNVWTPRGGGPYPVLFSIYGGGNVQGTASSPIYDGARFAELGLVYVNANYRVGAFGYLELGGLDASYAGSGLNGMRDQIAALQWIQDNIAAFGGDPRRVAIMGESAGAKNVCALATMPPARGLFQRIGVQSGGGDTVFASAEEATPVARATMAAAGLSPRDVAGLAVMPADALVAAQTKMVAAYPIGFPFRAVVDGRDLPQRPIDAARAGATRDLDLLIGTMRDESALFDPPSVAQGPFRGGQLANVPLSVMEQLEPRYAALLPDLSVADRHIRQLTAEEYWIQAVRFAEAHARAGGRTHMYRFDIPASGGLLAGYAHHGADVPYIYGLTGLSFMGPPLDPAAVARVHALWANWAKTGEVALADAPAWPTYDPDKRRTFIFAASPHVEEDPRGDERRLWDGVKLEPARVGGQALPTG